MKTFGRVLTAMITAFHDDGSVNIEESVALANHLLDNGSDGILVCGTTGENPTISEAEKLALFEAVAKSCSHKGSIIANVGSNNTLVTVEFLKKVCAIDGIAGLLAVVPYYNKPNAQGQYLHFKALAQASSLPMMIYNIPGRTGKVMEATTLKRLHDEFPDIIVGVKESSGSLDLISEERLLMPENFMIYSGDDGLTLPILSVGGCGVISVVSHLEGPKMQEMVSSFLEGDIKRAEELHRNLNDITKALFVTSNPIPVKYAMRRLGFKVGPFNLPMCEPDAKEQEIIDQAMKRHGLLQ